MNLKRLLSLLAIIVTTAAYAESSDVKVRKSPTSKTWGSIQRATFVEVNKEFAQPDMIYAPFAFWFWDEPLASPSYPAKAGEMARKMIEKGLNPGYTHPRMSGSELFGNMKPSPGLPREQWLSQEWFNAYGAAVDTAKAHNAYLGYNDEYMWPIGRAAGRVLKQVPDLNNISLHWTAVDVKAGESVELPTSFFTVAAELNNPIVAVNADGPKIFKMADIRSTTLRIVGEDKGFTWTAPEKGDWRVYTFNKVNGNDVNVLDKRLAPTFIEISHKPYDDRLKHLMGNTMPGVFCDTEGSYGNGMGIPWSDDVAEHYSQTLGRDIRLYMPLMLDNDVEGVSARARVDWFNVISDIYSGFFAEINDWLEERGMYYIANLWEESQQLQAASVGDHMKNQRGYTMPGTDCLELKAMDVHDFKEAQSVAAFEGRRLMSEIMGVAGWRGYTPITIKECVNSIITWGVGHVVPHGIFMTRDFDNHQWMPDWFDENPMWSNMDLWTDFTRRASYINSLGHVVPDVLLLNPCESVWALLGNNDKFWFANPGAMYNDQSAASIFGDEVQVMNRQYSLAIRELTKHRVEFLISDGHYFNQMKLDDKRLVRGDFSFKTVVVPPMYVMQLEVAKKLVEFAKNGGYVYSMGQLPTGSTDNGLYDPLMAQLMSSLQQQPNFVDCKEGLVAELEKKALGLVSRIKFISEGFPMLQYHRNIDGRDFFWMVNNNTQAMKCTVQVDDVSGQASVWNCENGKITSVGSKQNGKNALVQLVFQPHEAYWLVFDKKKKALKTKGMELPSESIVCSVPSSGWNVSADVSVQPNLQHAVELPASLTNGGSERSLSLWNTWSEVPENFSGFIDYSKTINISSCPKEVVLDLGVVNHMAEVWVNGTRIGARLWPPHRFTTTAFKNGENKIVIRVGNLVNNNYGIPTPSGLQGPVTIKNHIKL